MKTNEIQLNDNERCSLPAIYPGHSVENHHPLTEHFPKPHRDTWPRDRLMPDATMDIG